MKRRRSLTIVIKLGTSSIVDEKTHEPLLSTLSLIVESAVRLRKDGHRVILVSSGAIGVALRLMDLDRRPDELPKVQALAAIGQCKLIALWDNLFSHLRQPVAQILLTRNDIADQTQYLNAQNTFFELLNMGVIPIVNENDTLSVAEIKFGDNDTLSAITAAMVQADYLFLMTDVDCLYTSNPRTDPNAKPIPIVHDSSSLTADVSSAGSSLGTGGMSTKIVAARLATSAGVTTIITRSSKPGNVVGLIDHFQRVLPEHATSALGFSQDQADPSPPQDPPIHTRFLPSDEPIRDRPFWLLYGLAPRGTVRVDEKAALALSKRAGLLPRGILDVEGNFSQQEAVRIVVSTNHGPGASPMASTLQFPASTESHGSILSPASAQDSARWPDAADGALAVVEIGRALVNYSSSELRRIKGVRSHEIKGILGYADCEFVAVRENIGLFHKSASGTATPVWPDVPQTRRDV